MHEREPFPNKDDYRFPDELKSRYEQLTDWNAFCTYSLSFPRKAIRINTLKGSINKTLASLQAQGWRTEPIPWCAEGFYIKGERRDLGNIPEHALGHIYVQDAASMISAVVLSPQPGERVLDCCAAPGSKTTQLAQYMQNKGLLLANDGDPKRIEALKINLNRCSCTNSVVTRIQFEKLFSYADPRNLSQSKKTFFDLRGTFDKILVDAPCSGMGIIRKSPKVINQWSPQLIHRLATTQLQLLENAFVLLKRGGELVYSTCTPEPEENEGVVSAFLTQHDNAKVLPIELAIKRTEPITKFSASKNAELVFDDAVSNCLRIWPQNNDSEGFFVAHIKKE